MAGNEVTYGWHTVVMGSIRRHGALGKKHDEIVLSGITDATWMDDSVRRRRFGSTDGALFHARVRVQILSRPADLVATTAPPTLRLRRRTRRPITHPQVPALKKLLGNQIFADAFTEYLLQEGTGAVNDLQVRSEAR